MSGRLTVCAALAAALTTTLGASLSVPAMAADYYAGKTIDFIVGGDAGGGYDIYARLVAKHMRNHIPGAPNIVVKNMPGAGSARAGVFISTIAPKDGSALGAMMPGAIIDPLLEDKHDAQFDPTKVIYIGTADSGVRICATFGLSRIKTFADAQREKTVLGASATGGATRDYPFLYNHTAGTKFDIVSGYKGTVDIALAMERGEVDGMCGWDWSSVRSQKADWVRDNKINILVQASLDPDAELSKRGVPQIWDFIKNDDDRKVAELVISQQVFQRSYIAPPGTPAEQIAILRSAFDATVADPAFLADAEKARIAIEPLPGAKVQELVARLYASPKALVERAKQAIKP